MQPATASILVVDDERHILLTMDALLRRQGFDVATAATTQDAIALLRERLFDILLLDLQLPDGNGLDVAEFVHTQQLSTIVIVLTGRASLETAISSLQLGVHDYILKTANTQEVLEKILAAFDKYQAVRREKQMYWRIHSLLDELYTQRSPQSSATDRVIEVGNLRIQVHTQTMYLDNNKLALTPTEFRILLCLAQQAGTACSYQQIVQFAQGYATDKESAAELIKPHIRHLRQKIEADSANPRLLLTVRNIGYMFAIPRDTTQTT